MVVIISPDSMASTNVEDEWQAYLDDKKPVIPILHRPTSGPDIHFQLRRIQYIDFYNQPYPIALDQLQAELLIKGTTLSTPAASGAAQKQRSSRKALWGIGIVVALVVFGALYLLLNGRGNNNDPQTTPGDPTQAVAAENRSTPLPAGTFNRNWTQLVQEFDGVKLAFVPAGCFMMGSEDENDDAMPVHEVCLSGFWIGETEVTNEQYKVCVDDGACEPPADRIYFDDQNYADYPVVFINWHQADAYARWNDCRLPTEAQWEYAARGPEGSIYPWGVNTPSCQQANIGGCVGNAAPVGERPAGATWVGALDMNGNVWEWVADWYGSYPAEPQLDPTGPVSGDWRVLRGGAFNVGLTDARSVYRAKQNPLVKNPPNGFRVVCPYPPPQ
jgi:formylglycine-generating enzyme required for sulfatase activity